ncbi:hypothetical protein CDAR_127601 [Caerostris darwini]|uniref:Uncharacterized protein n=1 Tax=Caerostris darwini TaxID=1538125 RepID=A0AAV4UV23_9ARAC|nr:hypothetical protein CDAR_127601 [Caerostris darwini]
MEAYCLIPSNPCKAILCYKFKSPSLVSTFQLSVSFYSTYVKSFCAIHLHAISGVDMANFRSILFNLCKAILCYKFKSPSLVLTWQISVPFSSTCAKSFCSINLLATFESSIFDADLANFRFDAK